MKLLGKEVTVSIDGIIIATYEGNFKKGKKNGKGRIVWNDESVYEGQFSENNIHGRGIYQWPDERIYEGSWKNGKMNGHGLFTWPDGKKYEGEYKNDEKDGYGVFTWYYFLKRANGMIYKGYWRAGRQHGEGEFYSPYEGWRKGIYNEGLKVKSLD